MYLSFRNPHAEQFEISLRRFDIGFRFLLKTVEHVDLTLDLGGVDTPIGIATLVGDNLDRVQALHRRRGGMTCAQLGLMNRLADFITDGLRKRFKPLPGIAHPSDRL